jgi:hypothetical protein
MKKTFNFSTFNFQLKMVAVALLVLATSCEKDDEPLQTFDVNVQLVYPEGFASAASVTVTLRNIATGSMNAVGTSNAGIAAFTVVAGRYEAVATDERTDDFFRYILNGSNGNIVVSDAWTNGTAVTLPLTLSTVAKPAPGDVAPYGKLIIKELYIGGCQKDDGSGSFQRDPYIIIYNNSSERAAIDNLAFGALFPHNAHASGNFWVDGAWTYAAENWLPSAYGAWQYTGRDTLEPGEQIVVAMNSANNHTQTYSNSVNLANPAYYVAYDPESGYNNTTFHPTPSELIPTSHYLKAYRLAGITANAWTFSVNSPALFLFTPRDGVSLSDFSSAPENITLHGSTSSQATLKVPRAWVVDCIEVFQQDRVSESLTRFTPDVNVGHIPFTNSYGHTLYRNVDKAATEAILGNAGKLVYNYSLGYDGSTDPSDIDAEASARNGAHIVYRETNNTANDFHQRSRASLKD